MKETYYVGFDPEQKRWDASPVTHEFTENIWVFRTQARNTADALAKGVDQYRELIAQPSPDEASLMKHIVNQVQKQIRTSFERMVIEVPSGLSNQAVGMAKRGFFDAVHGDEIILDMNSAGWKAIEKISAAPAPRRERRHEVAGLGF